MAGKKNEAAATVAHEQPSTGLAVAAPSALAEMLGDMDFDVDGLGSVDNDDIKITSLLFNLKGVDEATKKMKPLDHYFNTTTNEYLPSVTVAFVEFSKMNSWRKFDQGKNKSETVCSSMDRVRGLLRVVHPLTGKPAGTERSCEKCPDSLWRKDDNGKNVKDCATVYNVFGVILDERLQPIDPFLARFAKTSSAPWKSHLNKHHIGKHPTKRGANVPLFMYAVTLTLDVDKSGNFAVPALTLGSMLPKETITYLAEQAKHWREMGQEYARAAEKNESNFGGDAIDTEGTSSPATTADDFADR